MEIRRSLVCFFVAVAMLAPSSRPAAQTRDATRAAFLKLIDRKRVPLAPQTQVRPDGGRFIAEYFTFKAEAGERVTGILMMHAASAGPRPAVIVLHGTGAKKEEQLAVLRTLADRGFVGVAIDARYHGERARTDAGVSEYIDALLQTYRTGKGRPYLYDTVWDTMRLVDYLETRKDVDRGSAHRRRGANRRRAGLSMPRSSGGSTRGLRSWSRWIGG